jgi:hypothetical protein
LAEVFDESVSNNSESQNANDFSGSVGSSVFVYRRSPVKHRWQRIGLGFPKGQRKPAESTLRSVFWGRSRTYANARGECAALVRVAL